MEQLLPLALTMMMGPQIITAIILVTGKDVIKASLGYITGVAFAATTGALAFYAFANLFDLNEPRTGEPSQTAITIQILLVILLIIATVRTYLRRETATLPGWMTKLQSATSREAFKTALQLIYLMPTDILAMLTVGINLASNPNSGIRLLPFITLTVFITAAPLLTYLLFGKKAAQAMPKVRAWMEQNSWVVSVAAYVVFIWMLWP